MTIKLLYLGPLWLGSTSRQRLKAFEELDGVTAVGIDNGATVGRTSNLWCRLRWKLRFPVDALSENKLLLESASQYRPDIVLVDNSKVILRKTLRQLRALGIKRLVYYSPDDVVARHNLSFPLKWSLSHWDIVCTTKTFNVPELTALNVRRPLLVGKAFDPQLHHPLTEAQVGPEFERFDAVFIGSYEPERCASINAAAEAGISIVVYGADNGNWHKKLLHPSITLRNSVFDEEYVKAWHVGKVGLCFLKKINRDRITQRTMEITATGRPMVAERTSEHDHHFKHGTEYLGFGTDDELIACIKHLLLDEDKRIALGQAARKRCFASGYSSIDRAKEMMKSFME